MGIFGSAIGGALGIGGSIFGGISASKAMKKAKKMVQEEQRENQDWYDRRYNEDATQRADAQRVLTTLSDQMRERTRAAAGTQAVMGGTDESVAAEKAAQTSAMADAASQIAVAGENRKSQIESQYMDTKHQLNQQLQQLEIGRANAVAQAVQGVSQAGANMAGLF